MQSGQSEPIKVCPSIFFDYFLEQEKIRLVLFYCQVQKEEEEEKEHEQQQQRR